MYNCLKYLALAVLLLVSSVDAFYNKDILLWSADITFFFQEKGGEPVRLIGLVLSSAFTFWMPVVVVLYNHMSNNSRDSLYHFTKYFLAVDLGVLFKIIFYQGRPYLASDKIDGCTCDPGMPSGHAIMAISGYYMIYVIFSERLAYFDPKTNAGRALLLKFTCFFLAAGVIWSRIALGAHSVDQLFIGSMISINVILWYDKQTFEKLYEYLEHKSVRVAVAFSVFFFTLGLSFLFINHEYREDYSFLKYYNKCPACKGTMVVSQSLNVAICQIVPGALLYYPYSHKKTLEQSHESFKAFKKRNHRFGVFFVLVVVIPAAFLLMSQLLVYFVFKGIYSSSLFQILYLGPVAFYVGMAMSYFNEIFYKHFGLDTLLQPLLVDTEIKHRSTFSSPGEDETNDPNSLEDNTKEA